MRKIIYDMRNLTDIIANESATLLWADDAVDMERNLCRDNDFPGL